MYIHTHTHTHTQTPPPPPHPEEGMATYSSTHAWRTPWTEEPIGLQSMGPQRVGQDWNNVGRTHPWCHVSTIKIPVISLLNIVCPSCSSVPHPGSRWPFYLSYQYSFLRTSPARHRTEGSFFRLASSTQWRALLSLPCPFTACRLISF